MDARYQTVNIKIRRWTLSWTNLIHFTRSEYVPRQIMPIPSGGIFSPDENFAGISWRWYMLNACPCRLLFNRYKTVIWSADKQKEPNSRPPLNILALRAVGRSRARYLASSGHSVSREIADNISGTTSVAIMHCCFVRLLFWGRGHENSYWPEMNNGILLNLCSL